MGAIAWVVVYALIFSGAMIVSVAIIRPDSFAMLAVAFGASSLFAGTITSLLVWEKNHEHRGTRDEDDTG